MEDSPPGDSSPQTAGVQQFEQATCQASSCVNQALNFCAIRREPVNGSLRRLGFLKAASKFH